MTPKKPSIAVHKFSSCDGCQLAFLNLGKDLLSINENVSIMHFAEAGMLNEDAKVDVAFVEGSISTPEEVERIKKVRENSKYLITIGACATSGGLQALRNINQNKDWTASIYAQPEYISTLENVSPISELVRVDFEVWGCPISGEQIKAVVSSLLRGVTPKDNTEKVCMECKREQTVCKLVTQNEPCMGPVTRAGCGAICPRFGRACYACYGPSKDSNGNALANRFLGLGYLPDTVTRQFMLIHNNMPAYKNVASKLQQLEQQND